MIYEGMYFWRRVVHACGRRVGGKKGVDKATISFSGFGQREKATISSSGSGPRAGYSCTDPVKWYVYSYQFMMNGSLLGLPILLCARISCTDPVELYVYSYQYNVTILGSFLGLLKSVQAFFNMVISTHVSYDKILYRIITN